MNNKTNGELLIRKVEPDDTPSIQKLIKDVMAEEFPSDLKAYAYYDIENPAAYYGGKKDVFLVAEKNKELIGTIAIKEDAPGTALLRRVFIKRPHRGKGYGDMLINKAMEFCFSHAYQTVVFRGTDKMQNALRLCLKKGFREEDICITDDLRMCILTKKLQES